MDYQQRIESLKVEVQYLRKMLDDIRAALDTEETGEALVEVARLAHTAELQHAWFVDNIRKLIDEYKTKLSPEC